MFNCYGVIYKITNKINQKSYIGQTVNYKKPETRIFVHFRKNKYDLVYKASCKYGRDNFYWEIIYSAFDRDELNLAETMFISKLNTINPFGYNLKTGGNQGGKLTEYSKRKIAIKAKDRCLKYGSPVKGRKATKEQCEFLSKIRKGFDSENRKLARELMWIKNKENGSWIKIKAIHIETGKESFYDSISSCAKELKLDGAAINRIVNKKYSYKTSKGYTFEKIKEEANESETIIDG